MKKKQKKIKRRKKVDINEKPSLLNSGINFAEEKDLFIENLSMMLSSGMDIVTSLKALRLEMKSYKMKIILNDLIIQIGGGSFIWKALDKWNVMQEHIISLIRIGEETGRLHENLAIVSMQQEKDREFKSRVKSAMMYPTLVMGVALVVGVGIAWFILPQLAVVFNDLNIELPTITRVLIDAGEYISEYGLVVIPSALFAMAVFTYYIFINKKTKFIGEFILLKIPGINRLMKEVELARFGQIVGTLLEAGIPIDKTLDSLRVSTNLNLFRKFYIHMHDMIKDGSSFDAMFENYDRVDRVIPTSIQHMLISGEATGRLPEVFSKVGKTYEVKSETTTKNLSVILEPILLVVVWGGVISIAFAVILPIYGMLGGINPGTSDDAAAPVEETTEEGALDPELEAKLQALEEKKVLEEGEEEGSIENIGEEVVPMIIEQDKVEITETSTGFLNVRTAPSLVGDILVRVAPEEKFVYREVSNNWYEIEYSEGNFGWVIGDYVKEL